MSINFEGQVAIVTGAGNGLGRSHALALASRGARVVVNDLGSQRDGRGVNSDAALEVVRLIEQRGGEAMANHASVTDFDQVQAMVQDVIERWGRVDILINNAGILRDKSFSKMSLDDFSSVVDVHLMGAVNCTKAVWGTMKAQEYGRIVMTSSPSGIYGNFGQANYGAAKMSLVGLMNTLVIEGQKYDIKVNTLVPTAGTRMTEDIMPAELFELLTPESVSAGLLTLCHSDAPNRFVLCCGAGNYSSIRVYETDGIFLSPEEQTPENILTQWQQLDDCSTLKEFTAGGQQAEKFILTAMENSNVQKNN